MYRAELNGFKISITPLEGGLFRIRATARDSFKDSLLERYEIISVPSASESPVISEDASRVKLNNDEYSVSLTKNELEITFCYHGRALTLSILPKKGKHGGFSLKADLDESEHLYGLGDESRESLDKRGRKATLWQANVITYGPVPFLMSSLGWGIFLNTTYRLECDLGCTDKSAALFEAENGELDLFIFAAESMIGVLEKYSRIVGKPVMLPKSAYGFTFVTNEETNARELLHDCLNFRREDIPCDIIGLEPGWMSKYYDFSVDKDWSSERFWLPWMPSKPMPGICGGGTFLSNLRRMGFKLSLWLCCDYDLLWEEEKECIRLGRNSYEGAEFEDEHLSAHILMDKITKQGEPWFKHLEKFVDNGAFAFKLDGARQVLEHPDRLWAGKYLDSEVHNVYPVIYAKQMKEGFERHTKGRRAMIYTSSLYAGTQKYAATWAGDTGGGPKSLISILNLALCGHSNASCDMSQGSPEGIHFGFLAPWAQLNSWRYWYYPWLLGDETEDMIRRYSKLRSALLPYIYSEAHRAYSTAIPLARPMCLMYPDESELANSKNMYMLGESLLIGAFDMNLRLPKGRWFDIFKNEFVNGEEAFYYEIPNGYGGALFAKPGAIWMTDIPKAYAEEPKESSYTIHITPSADSEFTFIEDDGVTDGYKRGELAKTKMLLSDRDDGLVFTLKIREGGYSTDGLPEYNIDSMSENHPSNIPPLPPVCGFDLILHFEEKPKSVYINGDPAEALIEKGAVKLHLSRELHEATDITVLFKKI